MSKVTKCLIELGGIDEDEVNIITSLISPSNISNREHKILTKWVFTQLTTIAILQMLIEEKAYIAFRKNKVVISKESVNDK